MSFDEIDRALLRKLYHYGYIGHRHTESNNALRGFPKDRGKEVRKSLKKLVRLGLVMQYPSTGEIHISLNPRLIAEVREIIGEN